MPIQNKNASEDNQAEIEEENLQIERDFEKKSKAEKQGFGYIRPADFIIKDSVEKKQKDSKANRNYKETIFDRINRIRQNRHNFQKLVEEARKNAIKNNGATIK